jgi:hypothetical protein
MKRPTEAKCVYLDSNVIHKGAQRGFVWAIFRIIGTFRRVGIGYFMVLGSSVKGNGDAACAHLV